MAVVALVSAKGAPGVTTTGLALALTWSAPVILAECDPAGGSVLAGYLQGQTPGDRGLMALALQELRSAGARGPVRTRRRELIGQTIDLAPPGQTRLLLPGLGDPAQSRTLAPLWQRFAGLFSVLEAHEPGYDVVLDCGRLAATDPPWPLLVSADAVLLVVRQTRASVTAAAPALAALAQLRAGRGSAPGLLVLGTNRRDPVEAIDGLDAPVVATIPNDPHTAGVLSEGGRVHTLRPLLRATALAESSIRAVIAAHRRTGRRPPQRAAG